MRKFREMIFSGGNKGFTLIELLVVIAVLGILAGIAIPRMTGITDEANIAAVEADLRNLKTGAELYIAKENTNPSQLSDVTDLVDIDVSKYTTKTVTQGTSSSGYDYEIELSNTDFTGIATDGGISVTKN